MSAAPALIDFEAEYQALLGVPSDITEHLPTLRAYAEKCGHVTEFGVRGGNSTRAFLAARPARLVSYDTDPYENVTRYFESARAIGFNYDYLNEDVLHAEIEPTDLLFIDTWHSYDQLSKELAAHSHKVGRWIILHDTETYGRAGESLRGKPECTGGLHQAIGEFLIRDHGWFVRAHYTNNNGLTVLERRS